MAGVEATALAEQLLAFEALEAPSTAQLDALTAQVAELEGLSEHDEVVRAGLQLGIARWRAFQGCRWADWELSPPKDPVVRDAADGRLDRLAVRDWVLHYERDATRAVHQLQGLDAAAQAGFVEHQSAIEAYLHAIDALEPLSDDVVALLPSTRRDALIAARTGWREAHADLAATVRRVVLPVARPRAGLHGLPADCYAASILYYTDSGHAPQALHDLGARELERIGAQLVEVGGPLYDTADPADVLAALRSSPTRFEDADALLDAARAVAEQGKQLEQPVFGRTASRSCAIEPIEARWTASWVPSGAYDDATFLVNTTPGVIRPWEVATITAHECSPGHHLEQTTRGETAGWPVFLHRQRSTAFTEGWAHYAESVAAEEGLFDDPLAMLGHLSHRSWRAARLVVDTGIHHDGWSDERATAFYLQHTALDPTVIDQEVQRIRLQPGQALAYKVGELELQRLRRLAEDELGESFDRARFHAAILAVVGAPVSALEIPVRSWIEAEPDAGP